MTSTSTMLGRDIGPEEAGRLDTFPIEGVTRLAFSGDELLALCPAVAADQPDRYDWRIECSGHPLTLALESKSLKLYLVGFRNQRIFAEHLAARIARDVARAMRANVEVSLRQAVRGGLRVEAVAVARAEP